MAANQCPICEMGQLHRQHEQVEVEFMGQRTTLPSHYSVCNTCGSEQATSADLRDNKRQTIAFRKAVMGLLTGEEVKAQRKKWRLTQAQAANVFGGGPVAFAKYEADDVIQAESMDKLIRTAQEFPEVLDSLKEKAGIANESKWTSSRSITNIESAKRSRKSAVSAVKVITMPQQEVCYA